MVIQTLIQIVSWLDQTLNRLTDLQLLKLLAAGKLGYMVKPHGQLVQVSSTPHSAYTPCLSTS